MSGDDSSPTLRAPVRETVFRPFPLVSPSDALYIERMFLLRLCINQPIHYLRLYRSIYSNTPLSSDSSLSSDSLLSSSSPPPPPPPAPSPPPPPPPPPPSSSSSSSSSSPSLGSLSSLSSLDSSKLSSHSTLLSDLERNALLEIVRIIFMDDYSTAFDVNKILIPAWMDFEP